MAKLLLAKIRRRRDRNSSPAGNAVCIIQHTRIENQLVAALKIGNPSPRISGRIIGGVDMRCLMSGSPLVALSQRIDRSKNTVLDYVKLSASANVVPNPTIKASVIRFITRCLTTYPCSREDPAAATVTVCRLPPWGSLGTRLDRVPAQNVYGCSPTSAAVDKDPASSRSPLDT